MPARASTLDTVSRHTLTVLALTGVLAPGTRLPYRTTSPNLASAGAHETGIHSLDGQCPSGRGDIAWLRVADVCDPSLLAAVGRLPAPARDIIADNLAATRDQHQRTAHAHQYRFCSCVALLDLLAEHTNDDTISVAAWSSYAAVEATAPRGSDQRESLYVLNDSRLLDQRHSGGVAPTTEAFSAAIKRLLHARLVAPVPLVVRRRLLDAHLRKWVETEAKAHLGEFVAYPEQLALMRDGYPRLRALTCKWFDGDAAPSAGLVEDTWAEIASVQVWRQHLARYPTRVLAVEEFDLAHDVGRVPLLCDVRVAHHELIVCRDAGYSATEVVRAHAIVGQPAQTHALQYHEEIARTVAAMRAARDL